MARIDNELYCDVNDMQLGNLRMEDTERRPFIEKASDEMDSHLSALYVTPLPYSTADSGQLRRTSLILNQICSELSSGRAILGAAGSKQDTQVHAYGRWLIERALARLKQITDGEIVLEGTGVTPVDQPGDKHGGPLVSNIFDSQVEAFYGGRQKSRPFMDPRHGLAYGEW